MNSNFFRSQTTSAKQKTEGLWGQWSKKSGRYSRRDCLRVKEKKSSRAGILTIALLDVEGLREKIEFALGFCFRVPGGSPVWSSLE